MASPLIKISLQCSSLARLLEDITSTCKTNAVHNVISGLSCAFSSRSMLIVSNIPTGLCRRLTVYLALLQVKLGTHIQPHPSPTGPGLCTEYTALKQGQSRPVGYGEGMESGPSGAGIFWVCPSSLLEAADWSKP